MAGSPVYDINGGVVDAAAEKEAADAAMRRAKEQLRAAEEMRDKLEEGGGLHGNGALGRGLLGKGGKQGKAQKLLQRLDEEETWTCPEVERKSDTRVSWFGFKTNTARAQNMNMIVDDVSEKEQMARHKAIVAKENQKSKQWFK